MVPDRVQPVLKTIAPLIRDFYVDDPGLATESLVALEKVFMLDASLAMDAYIASGTVPPFAAIGEHRQRLG